MMIFSGNANLPLAEQVAKFLKIPLGKATVSQFSDGETMVEILCFYYPTDMRTNE
jgi:ribose-phosphate pyrophosphokinase